MTTVEIDWEDLEGELDIHEGSDPEAILHEMAHWVDCHYDGGVVRGELRHIGNQSELDKLIRNTHRDIEPRNLSEVRVSVVVLLTMGKLGLPVDPLEIRSMMLSNLEGEGLHGVSSKRFDLWVKNPSGDLLKQVDFLMEFLQDFRVAEESSD